MYTPAPDADVWEAENVWHLRSHPTRLAKVLAHYELYQMIDGLPGAIVELGVYKGASLMRWATFRSILENDYSRPIIGFDAFGAFPREVAGAADAAFIERFEQDGGEGIDRDTLEQLVRAKGFANVELIAGDVFDTLPAFLDRQQSQRIALLHLDMDVYEPTAFAIEHLLPRVVRGGLIVFDDYTSVEGATRAADETVARTGLTLQKLSNYSVPAYAVVD